VLPVLVSAAGAGVPPVFQHRDITSSGNWNAGTMEYVVIEFNALVSNIAPNVGHQRR
jgi:hypothetical protein